MTHRPSRHTSQRWLLPLLVATCGTANADVGMDWPSEAEQAKAPAWPAPWQGANPQACDAVSGQQFLDQWGGEGPGTYRIDHQADLNMDGICEVLAYDPELCGKWCSYEVFVLRQDEFSRLGEVALGDYLEPYNGWLQVRSRSYNGNGYLYQLWQHDGEGYRLVRTDEYVAEEGDDGSVTTRYLVTR